MEKIKNDIETLVEKKKSEKTLFNFILLVLAIVPIFLAFYFYFVPQQFRGITYDIYEPSLIFDAEKSEHSFLVVYNDSSLIKDNIYLITGKIWNSGTLPLDKSDI